VLLINASFSLKEFINSWKFSAFGSNLIWARLHDVKENKHFLRWNLLEWCTIYTLISLTVIYINIYSYNFNMRLSCRKQQRRHRSLWNNERLIRIVSEYMCGWMCRDGMPVYIFYRLIICRYSGFKHIYRFTLWFVEIPAIMSNSITISGPFSNLKICKRTKLAQTLP
jgi:hypothetical protein